jgi:protein TonB
MFEQSLVTSAVSGGRGLSRKGSIVAVSVGVQAALVTAFLVGPLIWPATLPKSLLTPRMTSVSLSKPTVKIQPKPQVVQVSTSAAAMPGRSVQVEVTHGSRMVGHSSTASGVDEPLLPVGTGMGSAPNTGLPGVFAPGSGPVVSVASAAPARGPGTFKVSQGVMAGLLLHPIQPVYPRIAVAARQEGVVVVTAVIDKDGRIVGARALSGPVMLQAAAVDAVKDARYRPFLLNGEPTEVMTTVTVNFRLGA